MATCFATLLTITIKVFSEGGKTRDIDIQLVLPQSRETSCTFFVARFSIP